MTNNQPCKIIGLTGPIAAGKDEVAKILKKHGAYIIDTDQIAHQLYSYQSPVWQEIVKTFGSKILMRGGKVNRHKLGEIVFADRNKLKLLNRMVHPYLKEAIIQSVEHRTSNVDSKIVVNAAVLKEIGLLDYVDEVWVVMASKENRLKRLIKSGLSKTEARERINAQASQKDYLKLADVVIRNDGTLKQLNAKVQACLQI
jgi:dephospho-CoA kinase